MKFTGERYIPEFDSPDISYEHWHRYLFATAVVKGKVVLDIASGEGYGSCLLAQTAQQVIGVDADPEAVKHATNKYQAPNLEFRQGTVDAIPIQGLNVFDVVVSFETIEHVGEAQQVAFIKEIKRLLRPGGVFLVSTPDRMVYSDRPGYRNEYHQREFYREQFLEFLGKFFPTVRLFGQRVYPISYIWPLGSQQSAPSEYQLAYADGRFVPVIDDRKEGLFLVALCTESDVQSPGPSVLVDVSDRKTICLREQIASQERRLEDLGAQLHEQTDALGTTAQTLATRDAALQNAEAKLGEQTGQLREQAAHIAQQRLHLDEQRACAAELTSTVDALRHEADDLRQELTKRDAARHDIEARLDVQTARAAELASQVDTLERGTEGLRQEVANRNAALDAADAKVREQAIQLREQGARFEQRRLQLAEETVRAAELASQVEAMRRQTEARQQELDANEKMVGRLEAVIASLRQTTYDAVQDQIDQLRADLVDRDARMLAALESLKPLSVGEHAAVAPLASPPNGPATQKGSDRQQYRGMIERVRRMVASVVPANATIAVASKGDPELLELEGRQGWHFPQQDDGRYLGFHPADSAAAVKELHRIRARGAEFLVFPATALWWLEHYKEFAEHLARHYDEVGRDEQSCVIFALQEKSGREPLAAPAKAQEYCHLVRQVRGVVDSVLPADAKVVVVSKGDPGLLELGKRVASPFPQDADGGYAGGYPADSAAAIAELEELRRRGAQFLVIPRTASWWFDEYPEFGQSLETNYRAVVRQRHVCTIFDLN